MGLQDGVDYNYLKAESKIVFSNKSEILFRHLEEPDKLKSLNLGFVELEEMSDIPRHKMLMYLLLATLPLYIRYDYSNKYKNSNYQIFRDRWENEPIEKHKRNGKIILATFIIIVIIIPITLIFLSIIGIIPELPIR